jgi:glycerophosphoryl diester phosphodiesterase
MRLNMNYAKMVITNQAESETGKLSNTVSYLKEVTDKMFTCNINVKSINHRGYCVTAPENTLPAYKLSRQKGFYYVECDIAFTKDDIPVLLHDATINRTARDREGNKLKDTIRINDITYAEALNYDFGIWKDESYADTVIPTFYEFILLCKNLGMHPYIEMKKSKAYTETHISSLVSMVNSFGMLKNVTWISFNADYLHCIKGCDSNARLGYVVKELTQDVISKALSLKNNYNEVFISSDFITLNNTLIELCIKHYIPLEVWTVNNTSDLLTLNSYINGITSDSLNAGSVLYHSLIS